MSDPESPEFQMARGILSALGGAENVTFLEACATRLRSDVTDPGLVDENALKSAGAIGVLRMGERIQVIVGPESDEIADFINKMRAE